MTSIDDAWTRTEKIETLKKDIAKMENQLLVKKIGIAIDNY